MFKFFIYSFIIVLITGCSAPWSVPTFNPKTSKGAECKYQCAVNMQRCDGSSYTCDRSYSHCIASCMDIDRLSK